MKKVLLAACGVALTVGGFTPLGVSPAGAQTASGATALGYGANLNAAGEPVVDRGGLATVTLPPGGVVDGTLVEIPAAPLATSFTAGGRAAASATANLTSTGEVPVPQAVAGPYNAVGTGFVENLIVVGEVEGVTPALLTAEAVKGEAVGVCVGGTARYEANSQIIGLQLAGETIDLNTPLTDILDTVNQTLEPLEQVLNLERNLVTRTANGIAVDALRVTVLQGVAGVPVPGVEPLVDLTVGHAEVGGLACAPRPQCSDTEDNDGDGVIDANDPGCITDGVYDPNDDDERNELPRTTATPTPTAELPRTGGNGATAPVAGGLAVLGLSALALRRRSNASAN